MWKIFIPLVILISLIGSGLIEASKEKRNLEYWEVYFVRNGDNCDLPQLGESVKVKFEEIEEKGLMGFYKPVTQTIVIEKADTNTIAHESYHATMDILRKYDLFDDEEYGAYMVGSLVECIENIKG